MAKRDFVFKKGTQTVRFDADEENRMNEVIARVRSRKGGKLVNRNNLMKELMGLTKIGLVNESDRQLVAGTPDPVPLEGDMLTYFRLLEGQKERQQRLIQIARGWAEGPLQGEEEEQAQ